MTTMTTRTNPTIIGEGDLVFIDTYGFGLVPAKIVRVDQPGEGWKATPGAIVCKVTAERGAYHRGDTGTFPASIVVPRNHVRTSRRYTGQQVINVNYVIVAPEVTA